MNNTTQLNNMSFAVYGMGLTGKSVIKFLRKKKVKKYYIWDDKELRSVLEKDYELFAKYFDISENGNWEGKNILIEKSISPTNEDIEKLKEIKNKLLIIREKRSKPFFDDKTQIDLNAFWVSTLLFVAEIFGKEDWKKLALQSI